MFVIAMASENFKAKDIGLKAQKKLLSRMSNKTAVKMFIDDRSGAILDNTYRLFKQYVSFNYGYLYLMYAYCIVVLVLGTYLPFYLVFFFLN